MKKNLTAVLLVLITFIALCSCIINIEPGPYDPQPETEKFTYTSVFKGPVKDKDGYITSYQFMCYVNNKTGRTLENVKFEIDWKDQLGELIMYDSITIPRLEKGAKWPVGVIHKSTSDLTRLAGSTVSIRYLSSSRDSSKYTVNFGVYDREIYHSADEPSVVSAYISNKNRYDVFDLKIYVVSETSSGVIAEFGMKETRGILTPDLGDYHLKEMKLNKPAKQPANGKTYFYIVGTRD